MLKHIIDFYKVSAPAPCNGDFLPEQKQRLKRLQWSTFLAATLGYSMYYCMPAEPERRQKADCRRRYFL